MSFEAIYEWVDQVPLTRVRKNFARDFSDGCLVAEVVKHHRPTWVEQHNYREALSIARKKENWVVLNQKVLNRHLGINLTKDEIENLCSGQDRACEKLLVRIKENLESEGEGRLQKPKRAKVSIPPKGSDAPAAPKHSPPAPKRAVPSRTPSVSPPPPQKDKRKLAPPPGNTPRGGDGGGDREGAMMPGGKKGERGREGSEARGQRDRRAEDVVVVVEEEEEEEEEITIARIPSVKAAPLPLPEKQPSTKKLVQHVDEDLMRRLLIEMAGNNLGQYDLQNRPPPHKNNYQPEPAFQPLQYRNAQQDHQSNIVEQQYRSHPNKQESPPRQKLPPMGGAVRGKPHPPAERKAGVGLGVHVGGGRRVENKMQMIKSPQRPSPSKAPRQQPQGVPREPEKDIGIPGLVSRKKEWEKEGEEDDARGSDLMRESAIVLAEVRNAYTSLESVIKEFEQAARNANALPQRHQFAQPINVMNVGGPEGGSLWEGIDEFGVNDRGLDGIFGQLHDYPWFNPGHISSNAY